MKPLLILLEETTAEFADDRERFWIGQFTNLVNPIARGVGSLRTPEVREKISTRLKGQRRSPEQIERLRIGSLGNKNGSGGKGFVQSPEQRAKTKETWNRPEVRLKHSTAAKLSWQRRKQAPFT